MFSAVVASVSHQFNVIYSFVGFGRKPGTAPYAPDVRRAQVSDLVWLYVTRISCEESSSRVQRYSVWIGYIVWCEWLLCILIDGFMWNGPLYGLSFVDVPLNFFINSVDKELSVLVSFIPWIYPMLHGKSWHDLKNVVLYLIINRS